MSRKRNAADAERRRRRRQRRRSQQRDAVSRARERERQRSGVLREVDLPAGDRWHDVYQRVQTLAVERGHLGGYPIPQEGQRLDLAPGFPYPALGDVETTPETSDAMPFGRQAAGTRTCSDRDLSLRLRNQWHSLKLQRTVFVYEEGDPPRIFGLADPIPRHRHRLSRDFATIHAGMVWSYAAEKRALATLRDLVGDDRAERYELSGSLMETSKRSHVTYWFRRLRPTLALRDSGDGDTRILAALCLHPLAYYADTFAGGMVPTDDLIAHLLLMRADEHLFWRRANQHPAWVEESGC